MGGCRASSGLEESFRTLRSNLLLRFKDNKKCFLVTSARPGEGKSTVAANLAVVLAGARKNVLLVDANLRCPSLHGVFGVPNRQGFSDLLAGCVDVLDVCQAVADGLTLLPGGSATRDPQQLLLSEDLGRAFTLMRNSFDSIVVDSPPVLSCSDAALLAVRTDGVIVVLACGEVTATEVRLLRNRLMAVGATLLGSVLNHVAGPGRQSYHPYGPPTPGETEPDYAKVSLKAGPTRQITVLNSDGPLDLSKASSGRWPNQ